MPMMLQHSQRRADGVPKEEKLRLHSAHQLPFMCGELAQDPGASVSVSRSNAGPLRPTRAASLVVASLALLLLFVTTASPCHASPLVPQVLRQYARQAAAPLLEVFQVYPPVLTVTPEGSLEITDGSSNASIDLLASERPTCQQVLVDYSFGNSYGQPFVGTYAPPACTFTRITWNLTVTSAGKQFDRLGIVYLGDIEVFRTSTAEPTLDGIEWTYLKVSGGQTCSFCPSANASQRT